MTSTRNAAPDITGDELRALLGEITSTAEKAEEHSFSADIDDITSLRAAFFEMRERIAYMGWIGDRIAQRAGLEEFRGGADEWLLPPELTPSLKKFGKRPVGEIEQAAVPGGEAA